MPSPHSKRIRLTWSEKVGILNKAKTATNMSYNDLARWALNQFSLPVAPGKATIARIMSSSEALLGRPVETATRKQVQPPTHVLVDENVADFVLLAEEEGVSLSGAMIIEYARGIVAKLRIPPEHRPRLGPSWLRRFQERCGFRWRRAYGESDSIALDASVEEIERLKGIIGSYCPKDVFNMDESAFFYNSVPRGSICKNAAPALKQSKARVTMAICSNADGSEKLTIFYLGTAAKPRWLSRKPVSLEYFGTEKGWMTGWMYQQWLVGLDERCKAKTALFYC